MIVEQHSIATSACLLRATLDLSSQETGYRLLWGDTFPFCGQRVDPQESSDAFWEQVFHEEDRAMLEQTLLEMAGLVAPLPRSLLMRWHDSSGHFASSTISVLLSVERAHIGMRWFDLLVRRVSDESQESAAPQILPGQEAITQNSYFFEKVVETVNDGILVNAPDGQILFVNDNLAGILGYEPHELLGRYLFDLMDDEGIELTRQRLAHRKDGVEEAFDFRFVHRVGHHVWTRVSAKPFQDERGLHRGSLVAISDISERKRVEASLHTLLEKLEQRVAERTQEIERFNQQLQQEIEVRKNAELMANAANLAKSSFLANMSHELRTPLTAIIGYSQLLEEEFLFANQQPFLPDVQKIQRAGQHLLQLISDILDISKIEAGKMSVYIEEIDLPEFLDDVVMLAEELCKRNENSFHFDSKGAPYHLPCDRLKLRQILFNLLSNAAKFSSGGEVSLFVSCLEKEGESHCQFVVRDTGIGIHEDELAHLFRPFQQVDNRPSRKFQGAGLGLAISKEFCEMLGGEIHVESEPGVGSCFSVFMPLQRSKEERNSQKEN